MRTIFAYLEEHALPGAFIGLMATKDVSSFYTQFGFAIRPPERPGMFRLREGFQPPTISQQDARTDSNEDELDARGGS